MNKKRPRVKTALRLPPSAQAENQFSALFPGKRAEIYFPPPFRPFSGETGGNYKIRPWKIWEFDTKSDFRDFRQDKDNEYDNKDNKNINNEDTDK